MENNKQPMAYDLHYDEIRQVLVKHLNEYPNQLVGDIAEFICTKNDKALEVMVLMKTTEFDEVAKKIEKDGFQAGIDEAVALLKEKRNGHCGKEDCLQAYCINRKIIREFCDDTIKALQDNK